MTFLAKFCRRLLHQAATVVNGTWYERTQSGGFPRLMAAPLVAPDGDYLLIKADVFMVSRPADLPLTTLTCLMIVKSPKPRSLSLKRTGSLSLRVLGWASILAYRTSVAQKGSGLLTLRSGSRD